ncbi:T9SS type A sorting domain-containing protein [Plebeiibacterium sediminum]|uniref:T9SS type A sorting domain-containing protein n=1 Tax=Plebeiibacterium sediminum TaxID=2992112 RepID=A0AAE3M8X5_9BACT|nr:T9SS type A sorting domain-containing protein [Plebeiobacterium sediminum]MCW3789171.1 T9SS type A sorting domain-containing protein [Plebeiobacterium sediminum]
MHIKQIIVLLIAFISLNRMYAQPLWSVNSASYEYDMTVTCVVDLNGTLVESTGGVIVGAFDENENCVGKAEALYYNSVEKYRVPLMIFSNTNGVQIHLKAYIPEQSSVYDIETTIQFESNGSLGNFAVPYELEAGSISTGINKGEILSDEVSIFPNPAKDILNVLLSFEENSYRLNLYSLAGELIGQRNGCKKHEVISIENLPNGTYLLQIISDKGVFSKKFIKK